MVTAQKIGQQGQNAKPMGCGQSRDWLGPFTFVPVKISLLI